MNCEPASRGTPKCKVAVHPCRNSSVSATSAIDKQCVPLGTTRLATSIAQEMSWAAWEACGRRDPLAKGRSAARTHANGSRHNSSRTAASSVTAASSSLRLVAGKEKSLRMRPILDIDQLFGRQPPQQRDQISFALRGGNVIFFEEPVEHGLHRRRGANQRPDPRSDAIELIVRAAAELQD